MYWTVYRRLAVSAHGQVHGLDGSQRPCAVDRERAARQQRHGNDVVGGREVDGSITHGAVRDLADVEVEGLRAALQGLGSRDGNPLDLAPGEAEALRDRVRDAPIRSPWRCTGWRPATCARRPAAPPRPPGRVVGGEREPARRDEREARLCAAPKQSLRVGRSRCGRRERESKRGEDDAEAEEVAIRVLMVE